MPHSIQFNHVADLYDVYVKSDIDINFFLQEATKIGGKTLELTCGTGRVSLPLLRAGVNLTCVDYSEAMLAKFREKLSKTDLSCNIIQADITELSLTERFDFIFIPFHSFQEIVDRTKHRTTLERIANHLTENGRFICTLQNPNVRLRTIDGKLKSLGKFPMDSGGTLEVSSSLTYDAIQHLAHGFQLYHIFDAHNTLIETRQLEINFFLFTKNEFELLATSTGLQTENLFGDYNYSPFDEATSPFMIWKFRK
jgi:SAM-dependent methyltransferase